MSSSELSTLDFAIRSRSRELQSLAAEKNIYVRQEKDLESEISTLSQLISDLDKTTIFLNSLGEERQNDAQDKIEQLVTKGLQTIFDSSLSFHIVQTTKAKAANVEFIVRTKLDSGVLVDTGVMDSRGGGVAAVIGFLLRLVVMLLGKGTNQDNVLILDETFSHVSAEYLENLGQFLREIVDKTGVQIIMVTHQPEFAEFADSVYHFSLDDEGHTVARREE